MKKAKSQQKRLGVATTNIGTFYEFFAGGGMARAGLGPRWVCRVANDIDPMKSAVYRENWGGSEFVESDIRNVRIADLPGQADLAWASFPCQDLSLAGLGRGLNGERSSTFWPFYELINALSREGRGPRCLVIENVCGALTSHNGKDFGEIALALASIGYRFGAVVMDAAQFVPQSRPRLFILAVRADADLKNSLTSSQPDPQWHSTAVVRAHSGLHDRCKDRWIWWRIPAAPKSNVRLVDLIEEDPEGVDWNTREQTSYLLSLMSEVNREKVRAARRACERMVGTVYRRTRPDGNGGRVQRAEVRFDGVAGCLRTPAGGSSRQTILVVEGRRLRSRLLSPREAARLMGLGDEYVLPERYNDAYHVVGDGLVVPVVKHLAEHILEPLLTNFDHWGPVITLRFP